MSIPKAVRGGRIAFAVLLAACGSPRAIPVEMKLVAFVPGRVSAHQGDTLVFTNRDIVPHTVTAKSHSWDSGTIAPDSTWRHVVSGADDFYCTFHPTMTGSVVIAR